MPIIEFFGEREVLTAVIIVFFDDKEAKYNNDLIFP